MARKVIEAESQENNTFMQGLMSQVTLFNIALSRMSFQVKNYSDIEVFDTPDMNVAENLIIYCNSLLHFKKS